MLIQHNLKADANPKHALVTLKSKGELRTCLPGLNKFSRLSQVLLIDNERTMMMMSGR
jgi:hypothetical protein